ncbi:hypothetical protein [Clostridium estertheticum]|uniref:hypothetical protein n=1 Tax=Clostridium estertheticum TaxID=238834 RepID=UPI001CF291B7|nr:hypothetical protein [Clostridium estertheticum]MCB2355141.1 hypothetical protein [Clostridium estertheticum]WAG42082.1 hypothetical protein LL065_05095 [Clostridium estertheticum]
MLPKSVIETVELMNKDYFLGELSYDIVSEKYSFRRNKEINDLKLYPAEFYGLFDVKEIEVKSDVIRGFIVDRIIPYNRMNLSKYLKYYDMEFWDEWELFLKAKGMCFLDLFWIRKNSKETYKKCHIKFTNSVRDDLLTEEYFLEN